MAVPRAAYEKTRREARLRFAANLRAQRKRLGLTQERAAERVGFSLQYLQRIERRMVNVPLDTLARFASAYGVEPSALLRRPRQGHSR